MPQFSFGQTEAVLASLNRIASDKRVAFGARLKHLQRQGIASEGANPGRGRSATYNFNELMKMVLGVELLQTGFPPLLAAKLVSGSWSMLEYPIYSATLSDEEMDEWMEMPFGPTTREWLWVLNPEVLRDLSDVGLGEWDHMEAISPVPLEEVQFHIQTGASVGVFGESWRTLVLNGTAITKAVIQIVEGFGYATTAELRDDLRQSQSQVSRTAREFFEVMNGPADVDAANRDQAARQAEKALHDATTRSRFYPADKVAERHAKKAIEFMSPAMIARLQRGEFAGSDIADIRAQTEFLRAGLLAPIMKDGEIGFELTGIGKAATELVRDIEVPADAIAADRETVAKEIADQVQERVDALLAADPDYPEEEALKVAAHGGPIVPFDEAQRRKARYEKALAFRRREQAIELFEGLSDATKKALVEVTDAKEGETVAFPDEAVLRELVESGAVEVTGEGSTLALNFTETGRGVAKIARERKGDGDVY